MQQTEKLGLLWFCQWGQADEHICHAQIPLTFTLKRLLQTPRSFWRHYFTANYFHFLGFSLIINQLYKMLFNSILKSVLDDDLRTDLTLWYTCFPLVVSPGWLEGWCAALDDLGCLSVWHIVVGYLHVTQLKDCLVCYPFSAQIFSSLMY